MRRLGPVVSHTDKHHEAHRAFALSMVETIRAAAGRTQSITAVLLLATLLPRSSLCVVPALLFLLFVPSARAITSQSLVTKLRCGASEHLVAIIYRQAITSQKPCVSS